jgi:hypothetical protein
MNQVRRFFFTLQFYRYPMIVTEIHDLASHEFEEAKNQDQTKIIENPNNKSKGKCYLFGYCDNL